MIPSISKALANEAVQNTKVNIDSIGVSDIQDDKVILVIRGSIDNPDNLGGYFEEFPLITYYSDSEIGHFTMPQLNISAGEPSDFNIQVEVTVTNTTNAIAFASQILYGETFTIRMKGKGNVVTQGFTIQDVDFNKEISLKGMNGMNDVEISEFDFSNSNNDFLFFTLKATLKNPSKVSLYLGKLNLEIFFEGIKMAFASIDIVIQEGTSVNEISGNVLQSSQFTASNWQKVVPLFNSYLTGNPIEITCKVAQDSGIPSVILREAMKDWVLFATVPGLSRQLVSNVIFQEVNISPMTINRIKFGALTLLELDNPLGVNTTIDVSEVELNVQFLNVNRGRILSINALPATVYPSTYGNSKLLIGFSIEKLLTDEEIINFISFMHTFAVSEGVPIICVGSVDLVANVGPIGSILLHGVRVNVPSSVLGMNSLKANTVDSYDFLNSTSDKIHINLAIEIVNPSIATVNLGGISFDIIFEGVVVGQVLAVDVTFYPSANTLHLSGSIDPTTEDGIAAATTLFQNCLLGISVPITARTSVDGIQNPIFNSGFQGFELQTIVKGKDYNFVSSLEIHSLSIDLQDETFVTISINMTIHLDSPLSQSATLITEGLSLIGNLWYKNQTIGGLIAPYTETYATTSTTASLIINGQLQLGMKRSPATTPISLLVADFLNQPSVSLEIGGSVNATIVTSISRMTVDALPFSNSITADGLGGLVQFSIQSMSFINSSTTSINIDVVSTINNPSTTTASLKDITFDIKYEGVIIGQVHTTNLVLQPGENTVIMSGFINSSSENIDKTEDLINSYLKGIPFNITASVPTSGGSTLQIVNDAIQGLSLDSTFDGEPIDMIGGVIFNSLDLQFIDSETASINAEISIIVDSPLGPEAQFDIQSLILDVELQEAKEVLGETFATLSVAPIINFANSTLLTATINSTLAITDETLFNSFFNNFINHDLVSMRLFGSFTVTVTSILGQLTLSEIPMNEVTTLGGMDGLSDFSILSLTFIHSTPSNIVVTVVSNINNPSSISAYLVDLYFDIYYNAIYMGKVKGADIYLSPGNNSISLSGNINPATSDMETTQQLFTSYILGQSFDVIVNASNPASSQPTISEGFQGLSLSATVIGNPLPLITGIFFSSLSLAPISSTSMTLGGTSVVTIISPLGPNGLLKAKSMILTADLLYQGFILGSITNAPCTVSFANSSQIVASLLSTLQISNTTAFVSFIRDFIYQPSLHLSIIGSSNVIVTTPIGDISLSNIPINATFPLDGLNGLSMFTINSVNLKNSNLTSININLVGTIMNPSTVSLNLGNVSFDVYYQNVKMGLITAITNLVPGSTQIQLSGTIQPDSLMIANDLFQNHLTGIPSLIEARVTTNAVSNPTLNLAYFSLIN